MRKILLPLLLVFAFAAKAAEPPAPTPAPQHVEFKYYGFYSVVDFTRMFCLPHFSGQYQDPVTGTIVGFNDKYNLNGITAVAGWQWRKETALGLGFSFLNDPLKSFSQIPVFVEFRSHYLRSRISPFTCLQLGYSVPFGSKNPVESYTRIVEGGITFAFSVGARFAIKQRFGINLYAGYQLIQLNSVERGFNGVAATCMPELYDNIKFGLGVNF
ncbi:MAG: hypothetical protein IIY87_03885 [Bacteroidales bacterium]|nr:hypothetical protein [Bacteroidales bacterium]